MKLDLFLEQVKDKALRFIVNVIVFFHFEKVEIEGDPLLTDEPTLYVGPHPNGLVDPLLVALAIKRKTWFAARNELFAHNMLRWMFRAFRIIPVYRRKDGENFLRNRETMSQISELLKEGNAVIAFPAHLHEAYRIHSFQRGPATVALDTESASAWSLGIKIQPVTLVYGSLKNNWCRVRIRFGAPINIDQYKSDFSLSRRVGIKKLTEDIEAAVRSITEESEDGAVRSVLDKVGVLGEFPSSHSRGKRFVERLEQSNDLAENLSRLEDRLRLILTLCDEYSIPPYHLSRVRKGPIIWLSTPLVLLHRFISAVPRHIGRFIWDQYSSKLHPYYEGTLAFYLRVATNTIWYFLVVVLTWISVSDPLISIPLLFLILLAAVIAKYHEGSVRYLLANILSRSKLNYLEEFYADTLKEVHSI